MATHFEEFQVFEWMSLKTAPTWNAIEKSVEYLNTRGTNIDDSLLFDQY